MDPRNCVTCGQSFLPKRRDSRHCSKDCARQEWRRLERSGAYGTCSEPECERGARAKGLCVTHYNQTRPGHYDRPKVAVRCTGCGAECAKDSAQTGRRKPFCSNRCSARWHADNHLGGQSPDAIAKRTGIKLTHSAAAVARRKLRKAAKGVRGWGIWSAGACAHCGGAFVRHSSTVPTPWCSKACRKRAHARRHKEGGTYGRLEVFKRDGWRCHLCGKLTDQTKQHPHPNAPTIDHLIPRVDGGADTLANVRTAHSLCNSRRRQFGTVQLLLFGEVA